MTSPDPDQLSRIEEVVNRMDVQLGKLCSQMLLPDLPPEFEDNSAPDEEGDPPQA